MNWLIVLPILIPLCISALSMAFRDKIHLQSQLGFLGGILLFMSAIALFILIRERGIVVAQMGDWPAPFGITLVADHLSATMVLISSIMALATLIYSIPDIDPEHHLFGYYSVLHALLAGVNGSFLTGDIFNLYVWFEVLLMSSFVLLCMGRKRSQIEAAIPYVIISIFSSAILLMAVGILYGITGALNLAQLALIIRHNAEIPQASGMITTTSILFLSAFGIKAATFPLFFWLPASYHTPPVAVSALFTALLTKMGVYALFRIFTLLFVLNVDFTHELLLHLAGLTMLTGVFGAYAQNDFRRILSFHIISQIGYMIMGLALFTRMAITGAVFFLIHNILVKTNLFFISGIVRHHSGSFHLRESGGIYKTLPLLSALFLLAALSLIGIPPFSGFWGKLTLVTAGLETERYVITSVALFTGLMTALSMSKIWLEAFWKPLTPKQEARRKAQSGHPLDRRHRHLFLLPVILLTVLAVFMGMFPTYIFTITDQIALELMNPEPYLRAVLGTGFDQSIEAPQ